MGIKTGTAEGRLFHFQLEAIGCQALQHLHGLADDFGTDAVAGKNCDFHGVFRYGRV